VNDIITDIDRDAEALTEFGMCFIRTLASSKIARFPQRPHGIPDTRAQARRIRRTAHYDHNAMLTRCCHNAAIAFVNSPQVPAGSEGNEAGILSWYAMRLASQMMSEGTMRVQPQFLGIGFTDSTKAGSESFDESAFNAELSAALAHVCCEFAAGFLEAWNGEKNWRVTKSLLPPNIRAVVESLETLGYEETYDRINRPYDPQTEKLLERMVDTVMEQGSGSGDVPDEMPDPGEVPYVP
jgi:hypothetical protein